jgi:hypothetical protein
LYRPGILSWQIQKLLIHPQHNSSNQQLFLFRLQIIPHRKQMPSCHLRIVLLHMQNSLTTLQQF